MYPRSVINIWSIPPAVAAKKTALSEWGWPSEIFNASCCYKGNCDRTEHEIKRCHTSISSDTQTWQKLSVCRTPNKRNQSATLSAFLPSLPSSDRPTDRPTDLPATFTRHLPQKCNTLNVCPLSSIALRAFSRNSLIFNELRIFFTLKGKNDVITSRFQALNSPLCCKWLNTSVKIFAF